MEVKAKQRLIGAVVLVAVVAIFLPLLFHNPRPSTSLSMTTTIPPAPDKPVVRLQLPPSSSPANVPVLQTNSDDLQPTPALPVSKPIQPKKVLKTHAIESLLSETPAAWIIQVASFANHNNAKHLLQQLRAKGFDAYLQEDKTITRVFIGPDINRDKLEQIQKELKQKIRLNGVIKKYQPAISARYMK